MGGGWKAWVYYDYTFDAFFPPSFSMNEYTAHELCARFSIRLTISKMMITHTVHTPSQKNEVDISGKRLATWSCQSMREDDLWHNTAQLRDFFLFFISPFESYRVA